MLYEKKVCTADYSLSTVVLQKNTKPDARERLAAHGCEFLSTQELIMILLGSGTAKMPVRKLAGQVLKFIKKNSEEDIVKELLKIDGIGSGKASLIAAALELGRRLNAGSGIKIHKPTDILQLIQYCTLEKQEHFLCISLNGAHEILSIRTVSIGTLNRCIVHPREVYAEALKERAAAIILAHNHPSGNTQPSENDIDVTKQLYEVSKILGIHLLDHIIMSQTNYFSFVEHKLVFSA